MNASIYVYSTSFLNSKIDRTIIDYKCGISVMPDYLVLDIDSEKDFEMMQCLHKIYCQSNDDLRYIFRLAKELLGE